MVEVYISKNLLINFVKKFVNQDYLGVPGCEKNAENKACHLMGWSGMRNKNGNLIF